MIMGPSHFNNTLWTQRHRHGNRLSGGKWLWADQGPTTVISDSLWSPWWLRVKRVKTGKRKHGRNYPSLGKVLFLICPTTSDCSLIACAYWTKMKLIAANCERRLTPGSCLRAGNLKIWTSGQENEKNKVSIQKNAEMEFRHFRNFNFSWLMKSITTKYDGGKKLVCTMYYVFIIWLLQSYLLLHCCLIFRRRGSQIPQNCDSKRDS